MICYRLRCTAESHHFEGWFRSGEAFDRQSLAGLVACPVCASTSVERALMAPAVVGSGKRRHAAAAPAALEGEVMPPTSAPAPAAPSIGGEMPAMMRALLTRVREEVERTCDDVGAEFADQAIRMHRGEVEKRGIYGQTTEVEREILADEGVDIARIPWLKRADG